MVQSLDFLLEIGTEELPPMPLRSMAESLQKLLLKNLTDAKLAFGESKYFATPRRLAVLIKNLQSKQEDKAQEIKGPAMSAAFNADGTPTIACVGFAKSAGVAIEELLQKTFGKEERLVANVVKQGVNTQDILPQLVEKAIKELPIPKAMRWGQGNISFVRPVHSVLMLYGAKVIPAVILGKETSNKIHGHRFHHPDPIIINDVNDYEKILETEGYVIPDFAKRSDLIKHLIEDICIDIGKVEVSDGLLQEVTSIVEWPSALLCKFDSKFLKLPHEVLEVSLEKQQKCFPMYDVDTKEKKLLPYFVTISNIESKDKECVIRGNENVVRARLTDAEFFYKRDFAFSLESYFDQLKTTVFQTGLGSIFDKTTRLKSLAAFIAEQIGADVLHAERAAALSKSDLLTTMVGEFPELQGIMGYYYALKDGENATVAVAIKEQYLPRFSGDVLPLSPVGCALAIADKMDTLVGNFCLKKIPTGEKDPQGLRRAVIGILRIILEKNLDLDLHDLIVDSINHYRKQCYEKVLESFDSLVIKNYQIPSKDNQETIDAIIVHKVIPAILNFIFERLRGIYVSEKLVSTNVFNAVLAKMPTNIIDFDHRIDAILTFQKLEEAEAISTAQKRVKNILQKSEGILLKAGKVCNVNLFEHAAEKDLHADLLQKKQSIIEQYEKGAYKEIMTILATLKPKIDNFFDKVMVMAEDLKVRANRFALLNELQELFNIVADLSEL